MPVTNQSTITYYIKDIIIIFLKQLLSIKDVRNIKNKIYTFKKIALLRVPQNEFHNIYNFLSNKKIKIYYINVNNNEVDLFISQKELESNIDHFSNENLILKVNKNLSIIKLNIDERSQKQKFLTQMNEIIDTKEIILLNTAELKKITIICKSTLLNKIIEKCKFY